MKIALVCPYDYAHPGGVAIHIANLYEELKKMGHDVRVITPFSGNSSVRGNKDIIPMGRPVAVPSGGSIARVTLSPFLMSPVRAILGRENFDIIHIHEPLASALTISALLVSDTINVGTFHAYHRSTWRYRLIRPLVKRCYKKLHGKIAVSPAARDFIGKHFPGDYAIIPNGVDVERFSTPLPPVKRLRDGKLNILFVGRSEKRKGLRYLLAAYKIVKQELPQTRLVVVGPVTHKYEVKAKKAKLEDIVFTGFVPNEDLPAYYQTADVFCSPAIGEESFGIVLLEAMAASKPIVACRIKGYASVMSDGVQGLMVPPKDEAALAKALIQLLKDKDLRHAMGARGRLKAEECSWPNVASKVNEYYKSLLNAGQSQPTTKTMHGKKVKV
jgi:phosphatidylinositol alpha-mannosyltransferase